MHFYPGFKESPSMNDVPRSISSSKVKENKPPWVRVSRNEWSVRANSEVNRYRIYNEYARK